MTHSLRLLFVLGGGVGFLVTGAMQWHMGQPLWLVFIYACAGCWVGFGAIYLILRLMMAMAEDSPSEGSPLDVAPQKPGASGTELPTKKPLH
jgi:hypothetical protein